MQSSYKNSHVQGFNKIIRDDWFGKLQIWSSVECHGNLELRLLVGPFL